MSGPHFRSYHLLFDEQAAAIFATTDEIAERVRKIGGTTLRSIGHIGKALADPTALKGMISGRVTRGWARRNRPRWLEELERDSNRAPIE